LDLFGVKPADGHLSGQRDRNGLVFLAFLDITGACRRF